MRLTVILFVVCCLVLATECAPKHGDRQGKSHEMLRKTHNLERKVKTVSGRTAAESLRAFNSKNKKRTQQREQQKKDELNLLSRVADAELIERLEQLSLFSRAVEDPFCSIDIDCDNDTNRVYVDDIEFRTLTGQCNNEDNFSYGMAGVQHIRLVDNAYQNGKWAERSKSESSSKGNFVELPSGREISNAVHKTTEDKADNSQGISLALFYFMQFIDHDVIKTPDGSVSSSKDCCSDNTGFCMALDIDVADDAFEAGYCMDARRSDTVFQCDDDSGFQNQYNDITAYLDGSMIYGSSDDEMSELRTLVGGRLKASTEEFMPEATDVDDLACGNVNEDEGDFCFLAGDTRSDVHPGLTMFHTIFVREHNRIASYLSETNTGWSDDRIFFTTRKIIGAIIQRITFNEMLPLILDSTVMSDYGLTDSYSYNSSLDASITQAFSLAYRYHNLMPATFHFAESESDGSDVVITNSASFEQEDVWESPGYLFKSNYQGINKIALGQALNSCPEPSGGMNDASRNSLFIDDNGDKFDLAALNIERGREWGTPAYYKYMEYCGLSTPTSFSSLTSTHSQSAIDDLESIYDDVLDIDLWTGMVTETKIGDSISGEVQSCLVAEQFANLRNGDRFWYETSDSSVGFTSAQKTEIEKVTIAKIMCNNLAITKMRSSAFETTSSWTDCDSITDMDLSVWGEA